MDITTLQKQNADLLLALQAVKAEAGHFRDAIATICEGWTLSDDLRKFLETALWNPPTAPDRPPAANAGALVEQAAGTPEAEAIQLWKDAHGYSNQTTMGVIADLYSRTPSTARPRPAAVGAGDLSDAALLEAFNSADSVIDGLHEVIELLRPTASGAGDQRSKNADRYTWYRAKVISGLAEPQTTDEFDATIDDAMQRRPASAIAKATGAA